MSVQDELYVMNDLNHLRGYVGRLMDYVILHIRPSYEEYNMPIQTSTWLLSSLATVRDLTGTTNSGTEWLSDLREARAVLSSIRSLLFDKFVSRIPHPRPAIVSLQAYKAAIDMYDRVIDDFVTQLHDELDDEMGSMGWIRSL